jgi:Na+/H+ antiporter NhaC
MTPEEEKTIAQLVKAINQAYNSPTRTFLLGLLSGLARGLGATIVLAVVIWVVINIFQATGLADTIKNIFQTLGDVLETIQTGT